MYSLVWSRSAAKEVRKIPLTHRQLIIRKIALLASNPHPTGSTKLKGYERLYRFRQGNYRVIYDVEGDRLVIIVVDVGHRRDVYRKY